MSHALLIIMFCFSFSLGAFATEQCIDLFSQSKTLPYRHVKRLFSDGSAVDYLKRVSDEARKSRPQTNKNDHFLKEIRRSAQVIMGLNQKRQSESYKKILDQKNINYESDYIYSDEDYDAFNQGLKWTSFKISPNGNHWINRMANSLQKKAWPIDLYLDPALLTFKGFDGLTVPQNRNGRIGLVLYSDIIFHEPDSRTSFYTNKSTLVDAHEWIHVMHELNRRGVINYHSDAPINIVLINHQTTDLKSAYAKYFSFEEFMAYGQQLSIVSKIPSEVLFTKNRLKELGNSALDSIKKIQDLWWQTKIDRFGIHRQLIVGDPDLLSMEFYLPNHVPDHEAVLFAKNELARAEKFIQFSLDSLDVIPAKDFKSKQLEFIKKLSSNFSVSTR